MKRRSITLIVAIFLAFGAAPALAAPVDLVVVIDNSGSMRANDPQGLARTAVQRLIDTGDPDMRVSIVVFDSNARLEMPLTPVLFIAPSERDAALGKLDYRGQRTDIPGAIERALYHLQESARPDVARAILLLTDGIVDTGDAARDRDRERWLIDELAVTAATRKVRIFGIAFSDGADFRLIQGLAGATDAEYMRVLTAAELPGAFAAMYDVIIAPPPVEIPVAPDPAGAPAEPVAGTATEPTDTQPAAAAEQDDWQWWHSLLVVVAILGAMTAVTVLVRRRGGGAGGGPPPGAVLVDLAEISGQERISIPGYKAVIGRRPSADSPEATNIVIDRHTLSRKHASIEWRDGEYWIEDHQSSNGTFVDDDPVEGRVQLYDGARIRFDEFPFDFRLTVDDLTIVRGDEQGSDATIVRAKTGTTTVFEMPDRDDADPFGGPADEEVDFGFGDEAEKTGPKRDD